MLNRLYPLSQIHPSLPRRRPDQDRRFYDSRARARAATTSRNRLGVEWLETRQLFTVSPSPVTLVQPYNGQQLSQTPQNLVIAFNGLNVPLLMGYLDVQIEELNHDGTKIPIWNLTDAPNEESDPTGTELIVPLQEFDTGSFTYVNLNLAPGLYEVDLVGGTGLSYAASGAFGPGPQLWDPTQDHEIGTFTILGQGATLGLATPLGVIGSTVETVWGALDPDDPQSAVDLYQFTLPAGHLYQVGLAVSAYTIGSRLLPAISLLDSNGNVLETRSSGTGLPSDPNDPYFFIGLEPGTYYVGVSGLGNLANSPGGYDPILGIPGSTGFFQPGGPFAFALSLVASPHDQPTRLMNFTLDRNDPTTTSPTGITLTFSSPIDISNLFTPDTKETALEVVDGSGQVWPITAENYNVSSDTLELIFNQPLPAGNYALLSARSGGLLDLAGQSILGELNSSGAWASWTVAKQTSPRAALNLGVLWPISATGNLSANATSFDKTTVLAPGQAEDYRWTAVVPGLYQLQTQENGGPVAVMNIGSAETVLDPGSTGALNNYIMNLNDGVYSMRFVNLGSQPVTINWQLKIASLDWEKIIDNGVGQSPALSLSLLSAAPTGNETGPTASVASFQVNFGSATLSDFAGSMGPVSTSLFVTMNTGLIGQPTSGSQNIAAVGPTVPAASTALAENGNSLISETHYGSMIDWSEWLGDGENLADAQPPQQKAAADLAVVQAQARAEAHPEQEADGARADRMALAQAEWLVRLGARVQKWLTPAARVERIPTDAASPLLASGLVEDTRDSTRSNVAEMQQTGQRTSAAQADLGAAACVILSGAAACRLRRPVVNWWRTRSRAALQGTAPERLLHRGPHTPTLRGRGKTGHGRLKGLQQAVSRRES